MTQLQIVLERFRREGLTLDQLSHELNEVVRSGAAIAEVLSGLDAAFRRNELPPHLYFALRTHLQQSDVPTTLALGAATRVSGTTVAASASVSRDSSLPPTFHADDVSDAPTRLTPTAGPARMTDSALSGSAEWPSSAENLKVGDTLKERFVLEEVLGSGGMGVVFKALDLRRREADDHDPYVALKVLNQDFRENPLSFMALQRECKKAQTLSHPNIIDVYDFDRDGPYVFMSMEYLCGKPLNRLIQQLPETGQPFRRAWPLILGMSEALGHAHKKGIVHSDFKPGNVFVDDQGEVKVLDFGIACAAGRHDKGDATVFNARDLGALTPAYASLEMLQGMEPDARDDIYALACVTYELLSGKHPFGRLSADKALELGLQPKPIAGINRRQWKSLQKALSLRRQDRTATAADFVEGLQARSSVYYGAWAVGLIVLVGGGANIYMDFLKPAEQDMPEIVLTPERQAKIKDLLELAEIHFEVGYLTAPTGSNALWAYREVLKIDPYDKAATEGLRKIADTLEQKAWELYEQGDRAGSLKIIHEGLEAEPNHEGLLELKGKLEK